MWLYSKQTGGFYNAEVHGSNFPADAIDITQGEYDALRDSWVDGKVVSLDEQGRPVPAEPAAPTREQQQTVFSAAIQQRLDDFARTRNYDGILSASTYATSAIPRFKAEGQRAVDLRDATWAAAYTILDEVNAGTRPMPSGLADIEADLPDLEWPQ